MAILGAQKEPWNLGAEAKALSLAHGTAHEAPETAWLTHGNQTRGLF